MIEILGYVATALVIFSFTIENIKRLRIVNTLGCFLFTIYGLYILSIPIIITNMVIMAINLHQLLKIIKKESGLE